MKRLFTLLSIALTATMAFAVNVDLGSGASKVSLESKLGGVDAALAVTELTITGDINSADIKLIRQMAGAVNVTKGGQSFLGIETAVDADNTTVGVLSVLDLTGANIAGSDTEEPYASYKLDGNLVECRMSFEDPSQLGDHVFTNCVNLTSVKLPQNAGADVIKSTGNYAFYGCTSLTSVENLSNLAAEGIGLYAFSETAITEFTVPGGVTSLTHGAFANCPNLTTVTLPSGLTDIGYVCFINDAQLTFTGTPTFPASLEQINNGAFQNCTSLQDITFGDNLWRIGMAAFANCNQAGFHVTFPQSGALTVIDNEAFQNCTNLTWADVQLPNTLERVGAKAFQNCDALTEVKLPNNANYTKVEDSCFQGCDNLEEVTIPNQVTTVQALGFADNHKLDKLHFNEDGNSQMEEILYCGFASCTSLTEIAFPATMKTLGYASFENCTSLEDVSFADNTTLDELGYGAFSNCGELTNIDFGANFSIKKLEARAFYVCKNLTDADVQAILSALDTSSQTVIKQNTFDGITENLKEITLPDGLTELYPSAFANAANLEVIHLTSETAPVWVNEDGTPVDIKQTNENGVITIANNDNEYSLEPFALSPAPEKITIDFSTVTGDKDAAIASYRANPVFLRLLSKVLNEEWTEATGWGCVAQEGADVYINRAPKSGWANTFTFPFDLTTENGKVSNTTANLMVADLTGISEGSENATVKPTLRFDVVSGSISAWKPYLMKGDGSASLTFTNVDLQVPSGATFTGNSISHKGNTITFVGNALTVENQPDTYRIQGGAFQYGTGSFHGFRGWFTGYPFEAGGTAKTTLLVSVGDEVTSISQIDAAETVADGPAFNLAGQKVAGQLQKGLYIVNGKKVVVK